MNYLGKAGQGYVGCVDFETGEIDLIPANNKDDELERYLFFYEGKEYHVESLEPLGNDTGAVHTGALTLAVERLNVKTLKLAS